MIFKIDVKEGGHFEIGTVSLCHSVFTRHKANDFVFQICYVSVSNEEPANI